MPGNCENHLVITGDTAAISQIDDRDIETILIVPIVKVDRTQPFKLTIYFNTEGTSPATHVHITSALHNICHGISIFNRHLDILVGVYYHIVYHDEDVAFMGYVNCKGGERRFEYCQMDVSSIANIPILFIERFNIREKMLSSIVQRWSRDRPCLVFTSVFMAIIAISAVVALELLELEWSWL
jgi:hypothetical protein|tara:strand:+ start:180 stop:728 length:549 start_codon:yes stop_codon:yes gene_type:complete